MIMLEQPTFCFNSCDIGPSLYEMWRRWRGRPGMTAPELAGQIFAANMTARQEFRTSLRNIVINTHGYNGGLYIGGLWAASIGKSDLAAFAILKPWNIGTIWLVSCDAAKDSTGQDFCLTLAKTAMTQVIASDSSQVLTRWQGVRLALGLSGNIDDFEGTVYSFTPRGTFRGINPQTDVWTVKN